MPVAVILLAAGKGTRMNSRRQKILHAVGGKPMVQHVFETAVSVAEMPPILVVGAGETGVQALIEAAAHYVVQAERLGTGHATQVALPALPADATQVIVTYGDMPLLLPNSLKALAKAQRVDGVVLSMLTVMGDATSSFGRIVRNASGDVQEIVEVAEARRRPNTAEILAIRELNAGVYCFDAAWLRENIENLPLRQARSGVEYYLTDMVETAVSQQRRVVALPVDDADECLGAGTRAELVAVEAAFRRRTNRHWLANGVTLIDPASTFIDADVTIGQDTVIWPSSYLQGKTAVGRDCIIGPNATLRDTTVSDGVRLEQVVLDGVDVPAAASVPPFTWQKGTV